MGSSTYKGMASFLALENDDLTACANDTCVGSVCRFRRHGEDHVVPFDFNDNFFERMTVEQDDANNVFDFVRAEGFIKIASSSGKWWPVCQITCE